MAADNYITKPTVTTYSQLHAAIYSCDSVAWQGCCVMIQLVLMAAWLLNSLLLLCMYNII